MRLTLSPDQARALEAVLSWLADDAADLQLTLGGYAGTGKTTLIRRLLAELAVTVAVCAFTGKAAHVLRTKGIEDASTLHRLIYTPAEGCADCGMWVDECAKKNAIYADMRVKNPENARRFPSCPASGIRTRFSLAPALAADLVIVDEASMLSRKLKEDLESFGKRVLYVGDHGQLEPVGDDPGLMANPQIRLEQIHRQAAQSAIIRFAHHVRLGGLPDEFVTPPGVIDNVRVARTDRGSVADLARHDVVLCGFNRTRVAVNEKVRRARGFCGPTPQPGERVICLRNDAERGLFNGMLATVTAYGGGRLSVVDDAGGELDGLDVLTAQFGAERALTDADRDLALFDFGYCMTTHKAQGSEWDSVCVLEQLASMWTPARWRYTAATRAATRLTYCVRR